MALWWNAFHALQLWSLDRSKAHTTFDDKVYVCLTPFSLTMTCADMGATYFNIAGDN